MVEQRLLTEKEAAEYLGVPANTLRYWRWMGKPPKYRVLNTRIRYDIRDLDRWIEENAAEPIPRERRK